MDPLSASRFQEIDRRFAAFLSKATGRTEPALLLAAALASADTRDGHVCLDLPGCCAKASEEADDGIAPPPLEEWRSLLRGWEAVGDAADPGCVERPLVLDGRGRLYLQRYWRYERELAAWLRERAGAGAGIAVPESKLDVLFPPLAGGEPDLQREAAKTALRERAAFVTGGPGTGKTATVVRILALLASQPGAGRLDVALAAPTGKAAARLKESIAAAKSKLPLPPAVAESIPEEAVTLHRLLGAVPGTARCRRGPDDPLPHDVVIVDEASMIDLPMMAKLVAALSPGARLVLLGDRDQLASVEPGAVFGELCDTTGGSVLASGVVVLRKSWRFGEDSGIGALARLVNEGRGGEALALLEGGSKADLAWRRLPPGGGVDRSLGEAVLEGYRAYREAADVASAFAAFGRFRLLCAHREGPHGVTAMNRLAERLLERAGLVDPSVPFYAGRPVMVVRNDHRLRLANGDVGLLLPDPEAGGAVHAFFPGEGGTFRAIAPGRLPEHVSAYAMTVHKSQGSEFDRVLLLLGSVASPVLTRELVYTGVTRAKSLVDLRASEESFLAAVSRKTERRSGLREALAAP